MKRTWQALFGFCLFVFSSFALSADEPLYPPGSRTSLPFYRPEMWAAGKLPYVTVTREDLWRKAREAKDPKDVPTYEWVLPVSSVEGSREVARGLRKAWQRLEERTYWRVMAELNNPFSFIACTLGFYDWFHGSLNPPKPEASVSVLPDYFPKDFSLPLPAKDVEADGLLRLDYYSYFYMGVPNVPGSDFCSQFPFDFWPLMIPALKFYNVPIFDEVTFPKDYPNPIWLDTDGAVNRVTRAEEYAAKNYLRDYEKDVLEALAPIKPDSALDSIKQGKEPGFFLGTDWSGALLGSGVAVSPVMQFVPDKDTPKVLGSIVDTLKQARFKDDKLDKAILAYYAPGLTSLAGHLGLDAAKVPGLKGLERVTQVGLSLLQGKDYRSPDYSGIWPLEELKRFLPPSLPQVHEALGYTSYFQVYGRYDFTPLPDPKARWSSPFEQALVGFQRSLHLIHVPIMCDSIKLVTDPLLACTPDVKNIRPIPVPPYTVVFAGPRYYWDWVSVPESYPVPRVRGTPKPVVPVNR